MIFVHGLGESGLCFEALLNHPGLRDWQLLAPDLPGYGKSDWAPHPMRLKELAEFLRRQHAPDPRLPTVLIGHSMGGVLGQYACESGPQDYRAFVNVEGNLSPEDCTFSSQAARFSLADFSNGGFQQLCEDIYRGGLDDIPQRGYYASVRFCDPRAYHLNSRELVEASRREDLARRFSRLSLPKLFLAGLRDREKSRSVQLLEEAGACWEGWDKCGHWPFLDETERFVQRLRSFLQELS